MLHFNAARYKNLMALAGLFKKIRSFRSVAITAHSLADADAVGAAIALKRSLRGARIVLPDAPNAGSRHLLKALAESVETFSDTLDADAVVVLDVNTYQLMGGMADTLKRFGGSIFIVDHHSRHPDLIKNGASFISNAYPSTCEIIYEMLREARIKPDEKSAVALLAGIITDSARFTNANAGTFAKVHGLLALAKKGYKDVLAVVDVAPDVSERIALLKAMQRAEITRIGDVLIAKSTVSSFEAPAAEQLVAAGADIAFVGGSGRNEARISARMRHGVTQDAIDLAKVMEEAGALIGSGGGHKYAAGANGPKTEMLGAALVKCVEIIKRELARVV